MVVLIQESYGDDEVSTRIGMPPIDRAGRNTARMLKVLPGHYRNDSILPNALVAGSHQTAV
jgi:hypothetical protein